MEQKLPAGRGDQEDELGMVAIIRVRDDRAEASVSAGGGEKRLDQASIWGLVLPGLASGWVWGVKGRELGRFPGSGAEQPIR